MADVADRLRSAREQAGLSVEEIAARTRIKPVMLHALERGDWDQLPGPFFARAFTRTYARELGLPEADLLSAFEREIGPAPPSPDRINNGTGSPHAGPGTDAAPDSRLTWLSLAVVALLGAGVFLFYPGAPATTPEPGAVGTSGRGTAPERPAAGAPGETEGPSGQSLTMELRAIRPVWITASADGERVLFRTLGAGERITIQAKDRMSFRVGDAGAFEYSLNGTPGRPVGRSGEVREFTITPQNTASYLR